MYTIKFDDNTGKYVMGEHESVVFGDLLIIIAQEQNYEEVSRASSESHALHMLRCSGVDIDIQFDY